MTLLRIAAVNPAAGVSLIDTTDPMAASSAPWTVTQTSPTLILTSNNTPASRGGWEMPTALGQPYVVEFEVLSQGNITAGAYIRVSEDPNQPFSASPRTDYGFETGSDNRLVFTGTGNTMYVGPALQMTQGDTIEFAFIRVREADAPAAFAASDWSIADLGTAGDARITITRLPETNGVPLDIITAYVDGTPYVLSDPAVVGTFDLTGVFTDGVEADVYLTATSEAGESAAGDTKTVTTSLSGTVPAQASAPSLSASEDRITVTLAADPSDGGQPITRRDVRWSTDETNWIEDTGFVSGEVIITNLFETLVYVQSRVVNGVGVGAWSASASVTTGAQVDPPEPGEFVQMTFANPLAPTRAEVERLIQERWHTRPNWWINGTTPKVIGTDSLPAQFTYDAGTNTVTVVSNGGTLDGWDFGATNTRLLVQSGDDITAVTNCKFATEGLTRAQRVSGQFTVQPCIQFPLNSTGRIRLIDRCWFTVDDSHEGGKIGGLQALIFAQSNDNTNYPTIDVFSYSSMEGYGTDAMKGVWKGLRLGLFVDSSTNLAFDAKPWVSGQTYFAGDVVYNPAASMWVRTCVVSSTTAAPNWSTKTSSTAQWVAQDPHTDCDQASSTAPGLANIYRGVIVLRDQTKRRYPSRQLHLGIVSALRLIPNKSGILRGSELIEYCILPNEVEGRFNNQNAIAIAGTGSVRPGSTMTIRNNWHQSNFTEGGGSHVVTSGNNGAWDWWDPATLPVVSASYSGGALTYNFTANIGGWATVILTTSAAEMTATQIIDAYRNGTGLARFQIDTPANVAASKAHSVGLSAGTYYAHMLYQAGGGVDTRAPVLPVVVS